jgi:hypothetical protein
MLFSALQRPFSIRQWLEPLTMAKLAATAPIAIFANFANYFTVFSRRLTIYDWRSCGSFGKKSPLSPILSSEFYSALRTWHSALLFAAIAAAVLFTAAAATKSKVMLRMLQKSTCHNSNNSIIPIDIKLTTVTDDISDILHSENEECEEICESKSSEHSSTALVFN